MARLHCSTAAVCLASLCALPWNCGDCRAEEQGPAAQAAPALAQVLVLHDGGVLVGEISRVGERYVVRRGGSEIHVPAARVLITCLRLEDAYEHRRSQISRPSAEAHLSLAEWCLRHGLFPQAARELIDAAGLEPLHPRIALLERRLMAASKPRPREAEAVVQAAYVEPSVTKERGIIPDMTVADGLPPGAVERFTRRVQPILVNNCTNAGCHQLGGKQQFQLDRALLHGLANRRSTTRNLTATLTLVDHTQPQLSPLLTVPRRTHGGMSSPIFGPRQQAAFTHLVDWVALVTQPESDPQSASAAMPQDEAFAANEPLTTAVANSGIETESQATQPLYVDEFELIPASDRQPRFGAQLQPWKPKDPFDPEIFNRSQRSRVPTAGGAAANAAIESR